MSTPWASVTEGRIYHVEGSVQNEPFLEILAVCAGRISSSRKRRLVFFVLQSTLLFTHSFSHSFTRQILASATLAGPCPRLRDMRKQTKAERACVAVAPSC